MFWSLSETGLDLMFFSPIPPVSSTATSPTSTSTIVLSTALPSVTIQTSLQITHHDLRIGQRQWRECQREWCAWILVRIVFREWWRATYGHVRSEHVLAATSD
jgi:hypothetical protein